MRLALPALVLLFFVTLSAGHTLAQAPAQAPAVELIISGPQTFPLLTRGTTLRFTAVLINHSTSPVLFVPPHPDWIDERWTTWGALDEKGRPVGSLPQEFLWCDPRGRMHGQRVFPMIALTPVRQIRDSDLVILQPGESYQLPHVGDPRFYLKFLHPGKYRLSLAYVFQPSHYRLASNSSHSAGLAQAASLNLVSNSLEITLN